MFQAQSVDGENGALCCVVNFEIISPRPEALFDYILHSDTLTDGSPATTTISLQGCNHLKFITATRMVVNISLNRRKAALKNLDLLNLLRILYTNRN